MTYANTMPGRAAKKAAEHHRIGSQAYWRAYRTEIRRESAKLRSSRHRKFKRRRHKVKKGLKVYVIGGWVKVP